MTQTACCGGNDIFSEESQSSEEASLWPHSASGTTAAQAFHSNCSDSWRVLTSARDFAVAFLCLALSSHGHSTSSRAYRGLVKVRPRSDWNCLLSCSSRCAVYQCHEKSREVYACRFSVVSLRCLSMPCVEGNKQSRSTAEEDMTTVYKAWMNIQQHAGG